MADLIKTSRRQAGTSQVSVWLQRFLSQKDTERKAFLFIFFEIKEKIGIVSMKNEPAVLPDVSYLPFAYEMEN